jgi:sortase A
MTMRQLLNLSAAAIAALGLTVFAQGAWIQGKATLAQYLLEDAFAESIDTGKRVKPWSWADTWPVAKIEIPRIGKSAIALAGSSGQALAFGPGHLDRSADPGEPGTAVYAAHRDTHFAFLSAVKPGDAIEVTRADGRTFTYETTGSEIVRWDNSGISADARGTQLALVTCWPLDGKTRGPLRYVVHATLREANVMPAKFNGRMP